MKNKIAIGGTILMLAAKSVLGTDNASNDSGDDYRAHELSVDGFGAASLGEYSIDHLSGSKVRHNTRLGAGAGINYFFTRCVGMGADVYSENITGAFVDSV